MDVINRGMVFAATLLLCLFPFLIVVNALAAGRGPVADPVHRREQPGRGRHRPSVRLAGGHHQRRGRDRLDGVLRVRRDRRGRRAPADLRAGLRPAAPADQRPPAPAGLAGRADRRLPAGRLGGPGSARRAVALLAAAGLVWATGFWWFTMRILLAGRISWRALFPAACATSVLYVGMQTVFSLVFSAMVVSDEHTYGPIGTIFALLSYLIAIGVVVILGAVAAAPGTSAHQARARPPSTPVLPSSVATACACPGAGGLPYAAPHPGQVGSAEHEDARRSGRGAVAGGGSGVSPPPSDVQPPGCGRQEGRAAPQRVARYYARAL